MPRSNKANLAWVEIVGDKISHALSERHARPMIYRQAGPYNQVKNPHVAIYFNDPILHHIMPVKIGHRVDFRFGFIIERDFDPQIDAYALFAGFSITNPTLSTRFMMPNLTVNLHEICGRLTSRLRRHDSNNGMLRFGLDDDGEYIGFAGGEDSELIEALRAYARLRKGSDTFTWKRAHFTAVVRLQNYNGWDESDLVNGSEDVAESALRLFKQLDFLYSMLFPRGLGPSRMSGGQSRALKSRQPDRRCSWSSDENCRGAIDAAHIKPDRLGGHAVAGNLFWVCQFHHKLLDSYLNATLALDLSRRQIVATVSDRPPAATKADGLPRLIWDLIADKRSWPLPLRPEAVNHLFVE